MSLFCRNAFACAVVSLSCLIAYSRLFPRTVIFFVCSLPHFWASREDTSLRLAHFERRRSGKDRRTIAQQQAEFSLEWSDGALAVLVFAVFVLVL